MAKVGHDSLLEYDSEVHVVSHRCIGEGSLIPTHLLFRRDGAIVSTAETYTGTAVVTALSIFAIEVMTVPFVVLGG